MAYRLEHQEGVSEGVHRIAEEELDAALAQLREELAENPVTAVHEARKSLKKERALLRLVRGSISKRVYREENVRLREAGRRLSSLRDAQVAVQTVDGLADRYAGQLSKAAFKRVREAVGAGEPAGDGEAPMEAAAASTAADVEQAREVLERWAGQADGWEALEPGLARAYGDGRDAFALARRDPTDEHLHEWRKRVKDLWYHQRLLRPLWSGMMESQAHELGELSDLLGDDQDLANLGATVRSDESVSASIATDLDPILELIERRRGELLPAALVLGRRVYAERPKAYVRRHRAYARAWGEEARVPEAATPA
ncbi:MAG: CHAD domain-containing protein [Solirubrobacteraceae bacterium]